MDNSFEDILKQILQESEGNPQQKIEESISSVYEKIGVSEEKKQQMKESCVIVDDLESICNEIKQARKEGISKEEWIEDSLDELTSDMNKEDADKLAESMIEGIETAILNAAAAGKLNNGITAVQTNTDKATVNGKDNTINNVR